MNNKQKLQDYNMKLRDPINKIIHDIYVDMYNKAIPRIMFDDCLNSGIAFNGDFFNKFYLDDVTLNEIINKHTNKFRFKYWLYSFLIGSLKKDGIIKWIWLNNLFFDIFNRIGITRGILEDYEKECIKNSVILGSSPTSNLKNWEKEWNYAN